MNPKTRIVLGVVVGFLAVLLMIWGIDHWLVQPAFEKLERAQALEDGRRAHEAVNRELQQLSNEVSDWSSWDDAYRFAEQPDESFIQSNLSDWTTLERDARLNLCYIFDRSGRVIYGEIYDADVGGKVTLRDFSGDMPEIKAWMQPVHDRSAAQEGILLTEQGILLLTARPILTTQGEGPSHGEMIFGRFLDDSGLKMMVDQTRVQFEVFSAANSRLLPEEQAYFASLSPGVSDLRFGPGDRLFVYELMTDLENKPAALIRTPVRREISAIGQSTGRTLVATLGLAALIVLLAGAYFSERARGEGREVTDAATWGTVAIVILIGLTLTAGFYWEMRQQNHRDVQELFSQAAGEKANLIVQQVENNLQELAAVSRLMDTAGTVSQQQFQRLAEPILQDGGAELVEWIPRMAAGAGNDYFPIYYLEPSTGNEAIVGYDFGSDPKRKAAMEMARDSGQAVAATGIPLLNEPAAKQGIVWLLPVYQQPGVPATMEERRRELKGYVSGEFRIEDPVVNASGDSNAPDLAVSLRDLSAKNGAEPFYRQVPPEQLGRMVDDPDFRYSRQLLLGKQEWQLEIQPTESFIAENSKQSHQIVLPAGGLLTVLAALLLFTLTSQKRRAETLVKLRTAELQEREEDLAITLYSIGDAVIATDTAGRVIRMNPQAEALTGWPFAEAEGRDLAEVFTIINALTREATANPVHRVLATGQVVELANDTTLVARDGCERQIADSAAPIRDAAGRIRGVVLVFHDVSAEYLVKRALRESEERVRTIAGAALDAVMMMENDGSIGFWNEAAERIFGYSEAEAMGRDLHALLAAEQYQVEFKQAFRHFQQTGSGAAMGKVLELRARRKNGEEFPVEVSISPVRIGGKWHAVGIIRDITERKRVAEELEESRQRLQDIFNFLPDATMVIDAQGRLIAWNRAAEEMTGWKAEQLLHQGNFAYAAPFYGEAMPMLIDYVLRPELKPEQYDKLVTQPDRVVGEGFCPAVRGAGAYLYGTASRLYDRHGQVIGAIESIRDVSERWRAAEALKQSRKELLEANQQLQEAMDQAQLMSQKAQEANQAKSEFLANVSHEIRTPLNGVIGMTGLLLDTELDPEQQKYAEIVRASGEALLTLINDILDFSKIEARKLDLEILDFDLRTTVEDTAEMLAARAHEKGLELVCLIDPQLPAQLRGDPGRLRQIIINLVGNAVKFTQQGEVSIRVERVQEDDKQVTVKVAISDTGIGIPADRIPILFTPFTQVDGSTTRRYGGTGLGLAISKELTQMMGGSIGVDSAEGRGSTFWFTAVLEKQPAGMPPVLEPVGDLAGVKVLVVDDNETNRLLTTTLLRSWKCICEEAAEAETALSRLQAAAAEGSPFQVAILDMLMPGVDGIELGRRIKQEESVSRTQLIMLTSLGQQGDLGELERIGFACYLSKPIRQSQLRECLAIVLGQKNQAEEGLPRRIITSHTLPRSNRRNARILLAEDNPTNQVVAVSILKKLGYSADVAANGLEAVDALRSLPYDVVLMDCQMPEMDGFEATNLIRSGTAGVRNPQIPIIAMTAHALKGDRERCLEAGMDDYIAKPIKPVELEAVLERWLKRTRRGPGCPENNGGAELQAVPALEEEAKPTVFDEPGFLERMMDDRELGRAIITTFIEDMPQQFAALKSYLAAGDLSGAQRQAHTIKGAAANLGAQALSAVGMELERQAEMRALETGSRLLAALDHEFEQLKNHLLQHGWLGAEDENV